MISKHTIYSTVERTTKRRKRTYFSGDQLDRLEQAFKEDQFPGIDRRDALAKELGIGEDRIHVSTSSVAIGYIKLWERMKSTDNSFLMQSFTSSFEGMVFRRVASQFFLVSPRGNFVCPVPSFSEMKEFG